MKKAHPVLAFIIGAILIIGMIILLAAPFIGVSTLNVYAQTQSVDSTSNVSTGPGVSSYSNVNSNSGYGNTYYGNGSMGTYPYVQVGSLSSQIPASCLYINRGLSLGSTGNDVYSLQVFLQSRGLLNAAATGYYGTLTRNGVLSFQASQGIQQTGTVGPLTRTAITQVTCVTTGGGPGNGGGNPGGGVITQDAPRITSISPKSGRVGASVTIKGRNFARENNYVLFDGRTAAVVSSSDGKTLRFTVPEYMGTYCAPNMMCIQLAYVVSAKTYDVVVRNSNGDSQTLTFKVTGTNNNEGREPHINSYRSNYIYYANGGSKPYSTTESSAYFAPSAPAKQVTLYGYGFNSENDIYSNGVKIYDNIPSSQNGTELSFTVVGNDTGCGVYYCTDVYRRPFNDMNVYVRNSNGSSNSIDLNLNDDAI